MRHYTTHHRPGTHLTFHDRQILARDWNDRGRRGRMPTLRGFARDHGLAFETWRREFNRGRTGGTVPNPERPGRRVYALYDPGRAQDGVNAGHANKGAPMRVTNRMAEAFASSSAAACQRRICPRSSRRTQMSSTSPEASKPRRA